jgi:hypothetical protein
MYLNCLIVFVNMVSKDEEMKGIFTRILEKNASTTSTRGYTPAIIPTDEHSHKSQLIQTNEANTGDSQSELLPKEMAIANLEDGFHSLLMKEYWELCIVPLSQMYDQTQDDSIKELADWMRKSALAGLKLGRSVRDKNGRNENDKQYQMPRMKEVGGQGVVDKLRGKPPEMQEDEGDMAYG